MMIIFDLEVGVVCWISGELSSRVLVPAGLINFLGLGGGSVMESIREAGEALFIFLFPSSLCTSTAAAQHTILPLILL